MEDQKNAKLNCAFASSNNGVGEKMLDFYNATSDTELSELDGFLKESDEPVYETLGKLSIGRPTEQAQFQRADFSANRIEAPEQKARNVANKLVAEAQNKKMKSESIEVTKQLEKEREEHAVTRDRLRRTLNEIALLKFELGRGAETSTDRTATNRRVLEKVMEKYGKQNTWTVNGQIYYKDEYNKTCRYIPEQDDEVD